MNGYNQKLDEMPFDFSQSAGRSETINGGQNCFIVTTIESMNNKTGCNTCIEQFVLSCAHFLSKFFNFAIRLSFSCSPSFLLWFYSLPFFPAAYANTIADF